MNTHRNHRAPEHLGREEGIAHHDGLRGHEVGQAALVGAPDHFDQAHQHRGQAHGDHEDGDRRLAQQRADHGALDHRAQQAGAQHGGRNGQPQRQRHMEAKVKNR
jgi:hypothetical protein